MKPILSVEQTRNADHLAIKKYGIPSMLLMENAGRGIAEEIMQKYPKLTSCAVVCGPGNNGGDGMVIARWLSDFGVNVSIIFLRQYSKLSPDMKKQLAICQKLKLPIRVYHDNQDEIESIFHDVEVIVDALFGSGFKGMLDQDAKELVAMMNYADASTFSVDIPSGLNADTGNGDWCVQADYTVALETYKLGHFINLGLEACGQLSLKPVGLQLAEQKISPIMRLLEPDDLMLNYRFRTSHKGVWGKLMIIGACNGFTGATFMATAAALKTGAGYVYVLHREEQERLFASRLTEAIYQKAPQTKDKLPDAKKVKQILKDATAILIGPGLGKDEWSMQMLKIVAQLDLPVVFDGDALNLLSTDQKLLAQAAHEKAIFTPHLGEFCRLSDLDLDVLQSDPISAIQGFMPDTLAGLVLKSNYTLIRDYEKLYLCTAGNDGLAKAGSGDVLAGMIASFLAQGRSSRDSAINACLLLGITAEKMAQNMATQAITASGIIQNLLKEDICTN